MSKKKKKGDFLANGTAIVNKPARHKYEIFDTWEAGLELVGSEVKALRQKLGNLVDSFAIHSGGEIFLLKSYIPPYEYSPISNHDPYRKRKLLLHRREINKIRPKTEEEGYTLIPLEIYFTERGVAKLKLALARGKKLHDKREAKKKEAVKKEIRERLKPR